jgi:hypothetical protein
LWIEELEKVNKELWREVVVCLGICFLAEVMTVLTKKSQAALREF